MKVNDKVKVVQDNYAGDPVNSAITYGISIGDIGTVVEVSDLELGKENIIIEFPIGKVLCFSEDELEVV